MISIEEEESRVQHLKEKVSKRLVELLERQEKYKGDHCAWLYAADLIDELEEVLQYINEIWPDYKNVK